MDLSREVAERVMGWDTTLWNDKSGGGLWMDFTLIGCSVWNPLKDLNQCFEVVEAAQSKNKNLRFVITVDYLGCMCEVFKVDPNPHTGAAKLLLTEFTDEQKPNEAILKAALEAVK